VPGFSGGSIAEQKSEGSSGIGHLHPPKVQSLARMTAEVLSDTSRAKAITSSNNEKTQLTFCNFISRFLFNSLIKHATKQVKQ
jgi:hypothetical protein